MHCRRRFELRRRVALSAGDMLAADHSGIFLTGATGLVGGLLLRRLVKECPERPVYAR